MLLNIATEFKIMHDIPENNRSIIVFRVLLQFKNVLDRHLENHPWKYDHNPSQEFD